MRSFITPLVFALSADKFARAEDSFDEEGCIDLTEEPHVFDVNQACCHLYTEPYFFGKKYEICNTTATLPQEFIIQGIDSWVCGPHSQVAFSEGTGQ